MLFTKDSYTYSLDDCRLNSLYCNYYLIVSWTWRNDFILIYIEQQYQYVLINNLVYYLIVIFVEDVVEL
jgi:hypothetical protein